MTTDYHAAWRAVNTQAQIICHNTYGRIPLSQADTLPAIMQLKEHYSTNQDPQYEATYRKISEALEIEGFVAWLVHNALKRNYDKHKKGPTPSTIWPQTEKADSAKVKDNTMGEGQGSGNGTGCNSIKGGCV
ncbi:MAG: hypothetical protein Q9217_005196 [Psora testacea]